MARSFRFPRVTIIVMILGYLATVLAIEIGKTVASGKPADATSLYSMFRPLLSLVAVPFVVVGVGYLISFLRSHRV
jgi:hypothetical protein